MASANSNVVGPVAAPPFVPATNVRPLNRVWLYEEFAGEVHDLFVGYVQSWANEWPDGGWSDAIATASCSDEFMVLSMESLPTTSPPRDSYQDLVGFDNPHGYWSLGDDSISFTDAIDLTELRRNKPPPHSADTDWRRRRQGYD